VARTETTEAGKAGKPARSTMAGSVTTPTMGHLEIRAYEWKRDPAKPAR
jgi:hypothetical protein